MYSEHSFDTRRRAAIITPALVYPPSYCTPLRLYRICRPLVATTAMPDVRNNVSSSISATATSSAPAYPATKQYSAAPTTPSTASTFLEGSQPGSFTALGPNPTPDTKSGCPPSTTLLVETSSRQGWTVNSVYGLAVVVPQGRFRRTRGQYLL